MARSKHIDAGWGRNIPPASKYPIIYAGRNTHVLQVLTQGLTPEEIEAHADLAAAAPDLLRIVQRILNAHDSGNNGAFMGEAAICQAFATEARYAIAKATGVEPEQVNTWRNK